jgi:hypothetical protein
MTELQLVLLYTATIVLRIPRIKERWVAPLMRGPEWFFDVGVAPDFLKGPGATLLRNYRWRLFIPWSIEGLALTGLWLTGRNNAINILVLIMGITLFTRFNYYAARLATENRTRRFGAGEKAPGISQRVAQARWRRRFRLRTAASLRLAKMYNAWHL